MADKIRIKIKSIIQKIEDGLNLALSKARGNDKICVRLHSSAGWVTLPERNGNEVTHYIDGGIEDLAMSSNNLDDSIGVINFDISILCPLGKLKTKAEDNTENYDGREYPFLTDFFNIVQNYFSDPIIYNNVESVDGTETMRFSFVSSVGMGEITQQSGRIVISISGTYAGAKHIFSNELKLLLDGLELPQTSLVPTRSHAGESGVGEDGILRSFNTTSSIAFDITVPATIGEKAKPLIQDLFRGNLPQYQNKPHFLEITGTTFGEEYSSVFLMLIQNPQLNTTDTEVASLTGTLVQCTAYTALLNLNDFQTSQKMWDTSEERKLLIGTNEETYICVAGETKHLQRGESFITSVKKTNYELTNDCKYLVTIIASNKNAVLTIDEV